MGKGKTRQTSLMLPEQLIEVADRLIGPLQREQLYRGKIEVTRSLVLRIAVADGMHALADKYLGGMQAEEEDSGEELEENDQLDAEREEAGTTD